LTPAASVIQKPARIGIRERSRSQRVRPCPACHTATQRSHQGCAQALKHGRAQHVVWKAWDIFEITERLFNLVFDGDLVDRDAGNLMIAGKLPVSVRLGGQLQQPFHQGRLSLR
jgi:hypothetical protein